MRMAGVATVDSSLARTIPGHFVDESRQTAIQIYFYFTLLAICRPSGCTVAVASGVVGVVVSVYNRSQMRTSKCTYLIFGVSIDLDPG